MYSIEEKGSHIVVSSGDKEIVIYFETELEELLRDMILIKKKGFPVGERFRGSALRSLYTLQCSTNDVFLLDWGVNIDLTKCDTAISLSISEVDGFIEDLKVINLGRVLA